MYVARGLRNVVIDCCSGVEMVAGIPDKFVLVVLAAAAAILMACNGRAETARDPSQAIPGADPKRGAAAIARLGCGTCHTIPGIRYAEGLVGPPLEHWSRRTYIAGEAPNTPAMLVRWIETPQAIEPATDMPNMGVTEQTARDIAAYLYTLH
ncbi:MAG TPA: c-type cytochrome [Gemmatimonadaceae bacterium]|nr:c-type cytochrome [Gemmatimonadaceae bacterium]